MTIESDFYSALIAHAALTALVGDEIVPSHASAGVEAREYVVYTPVFGEPRYDLDGDTGLTKVRLQVDCYSETADGAAAIARAVVGAVPQTGWPLHRTGHTEQDLGLEPETRLFRRLLEFSIFHK